MPETEPSRWNRRLLGIFALQPGQGKRTLLVALYLMLVVAAYLMLKSASKSLFLERLGATRLPYATIATAVVVGVFVALYIRAARHVAPHQLVIGALAFFVSNLVLFRWLDRFEPPWLYPAFYVWVSMFGVIATTQVWTLANELFTIREAKRVFGIVGGGGIVGAISGGMLTRVLATRIGTLNLLLVAASVLIVAAGIVLALIHHRLPVQARADELPPPRRLLDSLGLVGASPHLRMVAALVLITALATKMVDWQFNAVAELAFDDRDLRTSFFGTFDAATGLIGFLVQILLTSRILIWLGLGGAILVFPLALTAGTAALIPTLSLWAATLAKGSDQTLKHSIDRSSRELVYLPVSRNVKVQAKSAIDMVVDRSGDGLAGFVQLAVIGLLSLQGVSQLQMVRQMGVINLFFLGLWILIALRLRNSYVTELGRSIASGRIEVGSWHESLAGAETLEAMEAALKSSDESTVLAALDLARANPQWDLTQSLSELARGDFAEARVRALAILLDPDNPDLPPGVTNAFAQEDQTLLAECIDLLLAVDPDERARHAEAILARAGGHARGAWIALMVRRLGPEFNGVARGLFEQLLDKRSPAATREVAATAIGMLPVGNDLTDLVIPLLDDDDPRVAAAAARSAAAIGSEDLLGRIVPLLAHSSTRGAAREALQSRGARVVPVLLERATDARTTRRARAMIPQVLAGVRAPEAVAALTELVAGPDAEIARNSNDALYRIRLKHQEATLISKHAVRTLALDQAKQCRWSTELIADLQRSRYGDTGPAWELLTASLHSVARRSHVAIFRTLSLSYSPTRMLNCRTSLLDGNKELRANAAEFLDNLTPRALWRELLPVLHGEKTPPMQAESGERDRVLLELIDSDHEWIRACAMTVAGDGGTPETRRAVEHRLELEAPWLRAVAEGALMKMDGKEDRPKPRTVVDKVMALRGTEAFRETEPEHLALIAANSREQVFPEGSVLCHAGDPPGDLFVLLGGRVHVQREGHAPKELSRGDTVGTWGLFEDEPRPVTATTLEETPLLRVDRGSFQDILDERPEIARGLIRQLIRRMRVMSKSV